AVRGLAPWPSAEGREAPARRARRGPRGARALRGRRALYALLAHLGRPSIRVGLGAEPRAPRDGRGGARILVAPRAASRRAVPARGAPARAHGADLGGGRRDVRVVPLRGGVLPADLPAARPPDVGAGLGLAAPAGDRGHGDRLDPLEPHP